MICDRFPDSFPLPVIPVTWKRGDRGARDRVGQIGVSWIPDDLWSRGKCGLKILQYQAAGLPVVANPVGSHCEMIEEGETGILATTPDEWVEAVDLAGFRCPLRRTMGLLARHRVEADYSYRGMGRHLRDLDDRASSPRLGLVLENRSADRSR